MAGLQSRGITRMSVPEKKVYKESLNLPRTAFAMEAKLVQNEPLRLAKWREMGLYRRILERRADAPKWVLHDGPPFANGDIHIGHLINKTLKDVLIRYKTLRGFRCPYVPGWDCHGLPIEHKIAEQLGPKLREMGVEEVRRHCEQYARKYVAVQSEQFQRLGILGDWENPYLTMSPEYEAATLEVFAAFVERGLVYRRLKPVPWSIANRTALADAELEYMDVEDPSVYVEFPLADSAKASHALGTPRGMRVNYLVWTTTPWTLPANLAVAVHPDVAYAVVRYQRDGREEVGIVAADLTKAVFERPGVAMYETTATIKGADLVGLDLRYRHPFLDRTGRILPALYVTTTDGTGLVHTAPGHGEEDYATGLAHGLDVYCPVGPDGRFDGSAPEWLAGLNVFKANPVIVDKLRELGHLFDEVTITHSYPHDWRGKSRVILRATEQWFIGVDQPFALDGESRPRSLRERALEACGRDIEFIPRWGQARISGMLQSRPDWCISRQRAWGLPLPVFYDEQGRPLLSGESVRAVARAFAAGGSGAWFTQSAADLLGKDFAFPPGVDPAKLRKEQDICDVWFESGSSWYAVLSRRAELGSPCAMYLEGSDQHRGWFQLSLLPALALTGRPPFSQVLTHGFVVKPDGTKVSKSDREYVTATAEVNRHGADVLRLWTCSVDYQGDIPTSPRTIQDFADKYRKIRNTLRYLLSNLYDFSPADAVAAPADSLDGWALAELDRLIAGVSEAMDAYQTHRAFKLLHEFCAVQVSAVYGNAMKDRLYCDPPGSTLRRRCQTVMWKMASALTRMLSPMIPFTADEAWEFIPGATDWAQSVHLADWPSPEGVASSDLWDVLMSLRESALLQLDGLKKSVGLNKALDAEAVYLTDDPALRARLEAMGPDLEDMVGTGCWSFAAKGSAGIEVRIEDRRERYRACARSWKRRPDVGLDPEYPDLCRRDAEAMRAAGKSV